MIDHKYDKNDIEGAMHMEEINSMRIEKLGNRITIISIILPCFIGIILFFAYMDINTKLANVNTQGQTEVKTVSDALQSKINSMIVEIAKIQHSLDIKFPELKKNTDGLHNEMIRLSTLKADKNFVKAEKNKLTASIYALEKKLQALNRANTKTLSTMKHIATKLEKNIKTLKTFLSQNINTTQKSIKKEVEQITKLDKTVSGLQKDIIIINTKIKTLAKDKIGKKEFDKQLNSLKKITHGAGTKTTAARHAPGKIINKKTAGTRKNNNSNKILSGQTKKATPTISNAQKGTSKSHNTVQPDIPKIKPGKILEQNLSQ